MTASTSPVPPKSNASLLAVAAWTVVAWLWLAGGSNYLTRTMLTTMRGSVIEDIVMTDAQFGLLTTGFLIFYAIASPFGGFLADRFSRRRVVLLSIFAWSLITWVTAYARTFEQLLSLRCLLGLSQAFYIPAAVAMIADYHRGSTRATATGLHLTGMIVGAIIGSVGGWIAETHGWSYAYLVIGLPNVALGFLLYFFLRDAPRQAAEIEPAGPAAPAIKLGEAIRSLLRPGAYYYIAAATGVQGGVSWIIIAWMPTLMREQFQMGQGSAGFSALGCLYGAQATGLIGGGFWSDRVSLRHPRARIIIPALAILLTTPLFVLTGLASSLAITISTLAMWGLAMGFLGCNTMPMVCLVVDPRYRATAIGVLNAFTSICGGAAIFAVGLLRDAKIEGSMILTFASGGVALCGGLLWMANVVMKRSETATFTT